MKTQHINGIEILTGSDNVFADLGLPDAKSLKIKTGLVTEIMRAMRRLDLDQAQAAQRMDISQHALSNLLHGDLDSMSEHQLMQCLNRLGCDIEIKVQPAQQSEGYVRLVAEEYDTTAITATP